MAVPQYQIKNFRRAVVKEDKKEGLELYWMCVKILMHHGRTLHEAKEVLRRNPHL